MIDLAARAGAEVHRDFVLRLDVDIVEQLQRQRLDVVLSEDVLTRCQSDQLAGIGLMVGARAAVVRAGAPSRRQDRSPCLRC